MSAILDFLLDLILDWDDIPSYEHLAPSEPEERVSKHNYPYYQGDTSVIPPGFGVVEVHYPSISLQRWESRISYEEYRESLEPDRGEQAFEKFSTYR